MVVGKELISLENSINSGNLVVDLGKLGNQPYLLRKSTYFI